MRLTSGTAHGGRRWYLYVVRPDYYKVGDAVVDRDIPTIKWFSDSPVRDQSGSLAASGSRVFLSGNFREHSAIEPAGDLLGNVRIMSEADFKSVTGRKTPKPAPEPIPTPTPVPGSSDQKKVDDLIGAVKSADEKVGKIREQAVDLMDDQDPGAASLIERSEQANKIIEQARRGFEPDWEQKLSELLPEVRVYQDVVISPESFLKIAEALLEHGISALNLAAENPDDASAAADLGNVNVQIEPRPGEVQNLTLKPMFEPKDLQEGVDYVESNFIAPLQAEIERARAAQAQGVPEFDHESPFIPKSTKKVRQVEEVDRDVKQVFDKAQGKALEFQSIMVSLGFPDAVRERDEALRKLELSRYEVPSQRQRIEDFRKTRLTRAASWVDRECRFASCARVVVRVAWRPQVSAS